MLLYHGNPRSKDLERPGEMVAESTPTPTWCTPFSKQTGWSKNYSLTYEKYQNKNNGGYDQEWYEHDILLKQEMEWLHGKIAQHYKSRSNCTWEEIAAEVHRPELFCEAFWKQCRDYPLDTLKLKVDVWMQYRDVNKKYCKRAERLEGLAKTKASASVTAEVGGKAKAKGEAEAQGKAEEAEEKAEGEAETERKAEDEEEAKSETETDNEAEPVRNAPRSHRPFAPGGRYAGE